jgi:hypothetical protein
MTPGLSKVIQDKSVLESLLYALLRVEQPLLINTGLIEHLNLSPLLEDGQPLHRWDDFAPYLQPLAFSLRVHILVNSDQDEHEENWPQTITNLEQLVESGSTPYARNVLFLATIRGFLKGKKVLRRACALVLSRQAAIGMLFPIPWTAAADFTVAELREKIFSLGCDSEGSGCQGNGPESLLTHEAVLSQLAELCGDEDENCRDTCAKTFIKLAGHGMHSKAW